MLQTMHQAQLISTILSWSIDRLETVIATQTNHELLLNLLNMAFEASDPAISADERAALSEEFSVTYNELPDEICGDHFYDKAQDMLATQEKALTQYEFIKSRFDEMTELLDTIEPEDDFNPLRDQILHLSDLAWQASGDLDVNAREDADYEFMSIVDHFPGDLVVYLGLYHLAEVHG